MDGAMKQNTGSSFDKIENFEEEKTRILVLTQESGPNHPLPGKEGGTLYSRMQFHLVDLESDKVHLHCIPSLLQCAPLSSVVSVDNSVYIFGCRPFIPEYESETESESETETETETQELDRFESFPQDKVFLGASRYDLSSLKSHQTNVWCPAPIPTRKCILPVCVTLYDKIYVFGFNYFEPEVLDPTVGQPKALNLPCELVGCKVSNYPLPDPSNRRILMHLSGGQLPSPSIYAFSPNDDSTGGNWECIAVDFQDWTNTAAIVDNVIYFYKPSFPYFVRAFDLATGTWLKIRWKSKFKKVRGWNTRMDFDAMIPLGNRILCFILWLHIPEKGITCWANVYFFKFGVERTGVTVNLFPLKSYSYELPDTWQVQAFLPV